MLSYVKFGYACYYIQFFEGQNIQFVPKTDLILIFVTDYKSLSCCIRTLFISILQLNKIHHFTQDTYNRYRFLGLTLNLHN